MSILNAEQANPRVDKVITGALLSTGTPPTTESTTLLNPRIFRSHGESNPESEVLPRLFTKALVTTKLQKFGS